MAKINLDQLDLKELKALRKDVDDAIIDYEKRKKSEALAAAQAAAKEFGFSLAELLGDTQQKKGRATINPAKYRHPENPSVTWTGKGRKPGWIKEAIEAGTDLDKFLIE